ncbi:MAG: ABC transporter ATP-binding protein [Euryarchaeota archaeon]|nr:ABC transporter ATP-binding protein [Euryarchaeota archaeon]
MIMEVDGLSQGYGNNLVIDDISFTAKSGELLTVLGPNGCGKSTLIKTLCNVLSPKKGTIYVDKRDLSNIDPKEMARLIGYVPQTMTHFGHSTVYDLVLIGRRPYVDWSYSTNDLRVAADAMITMNVNAYISRNIRELSGGQRQRAFIARALAQEPNFYIFDEPTSSFDLRNQLDTMRIMRNIIHEKEACLIVALHDLNLAMRYSDRVMVLNDREIYDIGEPEDVITSKMIKDVYGVTADIMEDMHGLFVRTYDINTDLVEDRA